VVYAFILGAGHYLRTLDVRRQEAMRAERLRADLASAQLRALTLQLQPHFLFNALNAVGALILTERHREAFDMVGQLGDLLRVLLAIERREEVSLREELELTEAYVGVEQARLGDRLRVSWDVAQELGGAQVPPMLLQPLVENAVRHGVAPKPGGGRLTISAHRRDATLVLTVVDDGPTGASRPPSSEGAQSPPLTTGLGLDNTRRRLAHLYGDATRLDLSRDGGWTRVVVEVPYHLAPGSSASRAEVAA
jgi:two-component system sensor histidine kinase AlgZ